ncbi:prolyl oligopeptidase family serine peptidase [Streptomyces sp. RFCAC02]|uniref:prolyl oligopeptidase family serine peptidase n=1 Tax=Streptomyces sp. RFCAC02 TaxID=2499143 RepID=UPI0010223E2A|nr:prolyl oligopeptidase family serine peptidase [Streptomyces sp. RFCAC02]
MTRDTAAPVAAPRSPVADTLHGRSVEDPYRWLEDDDSPACDRWLAAQRALWETHAPHWPARPYFAARLRELAAAGALAGPGQSPPVVRGSRHFAVRAAGEDRRRVLAVVDDGAPDGAGRVVLDPLTVDPEGLTVLETWRPSWSGDLVACRLRDRRDGRQHLWTWDVATARPVEGPLPLRAPGSVAWLPGDTGFYCTATGDDGRQRVLLHRTGDPVSGDTPVLTTSDHLSVGTSSDGRWLVVNRSPGTMRGNALYLADISGGRFTDLSPQLLHDGTADGSQALLRFGPGSLVYAVTDAAAPRGRVCLVDPRHPRSADWRTVITPEDGAVIGACVALADPATGAARFLVTASRDGRPTVSLHETTGGKLADLPVPGRGPGRISGLTCPPGDTGVAWFSYTDHITPPTVHRVDLRDMRPRPVTPPPRAAAGVRVRQTTFPAADGTPVPICLILPPDGPGARGPLPTVLTAYGGFGATFAPGYSPTILAWVQAGGAYAVAGVRGGGDLGKQWHAAGSGPNKPTAFDDFAAAAAWLTAEGVTTPGQLAVKGTSHSGLMAAVALTRAPHGCAAAVVGAAVTDMVRYPLLGRGALWLGEFGDPGDPAALDTLLSYSPYHNVRPGTAYPAVLLTTHRTDPRVGAAHTRKFTAALQHATTGGPVLLRTQDGAGHGPDTAAQWADLEADALAFCAVHTRMPGPPASPTVRHDPPAASSARADP